MTKLTVKRDRDQNIETAIMDETIDVPITGHLHETTDHPPETTDHRLGTDQDTRTDHNRLHIATTEAEMIQDHLVAIITDTIEIDLLTTLAVETVETITTPETLHLHVTIKET